MTTHIPDDRDTPEGAAAMESGFAARVRRHTVSVGTQQQQGDHNGPDWLKIQEIRKQQQQEQQRQM